jgi:hypothetical protein
MNKILDFAKHKLKKERTEYEEELDTPIVITMREIEELAVDIVMGFAEKHGIEDLLTQKMIKDKKNGNI